MICPSCCHKNLPGDEVCKHCKQPLTPFDLPQPENSVERGVMYDQVKTLKQNPPVTIGLVATISEALALMLSANVGALMVVDGAGQLTGIFSERDLLKKIVGLRTDYENLPIAQFMTSRPECVSTTDTLNFVLQKMDAGGYRHVPVVENGRPISVISVRDMIRHITRLCKEG